MRSTALIALAITITLALAATPALACSQRPDTYESSLDAMIPCISVSMEDDYINDVASFTYTCAQGGPAVTLSSQGGMITIDAQTVDAKLLITKETDASSYDPATRRWASRMLAISWAQGDQTGAATLSYVRITSASDSDDCPEDDSSCAAAPRSPATPAPLLALPLLLGALVWRRRAK